MNGVSHHVIPETADDSAIVSNRVEESDDKESNEQDSASNKQDGASKREIEEEVTLTFPQRVSQRGATIMMIERRNVI
jgi:hypothetical protein